MIADFPSRQRYYAVQTEVNGNRGSVYAGSSADTPKFAVMAIAHGGKTRDDSKIPALIKDGSSRLDSVAEVRWYHFERWKAHFPSSIEMYSQSRPFLEHHVRCALAARANVRFIEECEVSRLLANGDHTRVTGVQLRHHNDERSEENLIADLVVDASGRGSQAPQWLTSLGYTRVKESSVKVDVGYATRVYRLPRQISCDWKALIINPTPPTSKRGGIVLPIEGGYWMVSLAGWLRDYPPIDETAFLEFARSLPVPDLYEAIKDAEPMTTIVPHKFPANRRHHYELMPHFPEGFVVLGDAACSFNPVYGQGMTTAALEASTLRACLQQQQEQGLRSRRNVAGLAHHIQKAVAKVVDVPWLLATSEDFRYPETEGHRPVSLGLLNWYTRRVHELVVDDHEAALRFYEVVHMLKSPMALFVPHILFAVLFKRWQTRASQRTEMVLRPQPEQS